MTNAPIRRTVSTLPVIVLLLVGGWILGGCGSGAAGTAADAEVDARDTIDRPPPPVITAPENTFNVTMSTSSGQLLVDKLEIEFNRRRGIHEFYGFYRDAYDEMVRIPFRNLSRVDFLGEMPAGLFEQAIIGREQENLRHAHAFTVRLTFKNQSQEEFFAIIPKFRGEKDLQLWEFSMNSKNRAIQTIEFDR